ncbi:MAG TPA: ABC transporter transmembrane domain-containing protein [Alphaproteobacteria bacterium]|nr:ABC transporter transmembrane domain-containing protein [Alphaproteobacteria bacterium]
MPETIATPTDRKARFRPLARLKPWLAPYKAALAGALAALLVAGLTVLAIPMGLKTVIDRGFAADNPAMLNHSLFLLLIAIVVLAGATFARFSLVAWLGERVVADLRRALYDRILSLSPAFFEITRSGDIISRLTADCAILQTVVGSSLSMALRNCVLLVGGTIMMLLTSPKLSGLVALGIPVVVVPIIVFGRKVRKLSKATQERVADVSSYAEETVYGIRTVQAFGHEALDRAAFGTHVEGAVQTAIRRIRARAWLTALVIVLVFTAIGVILWMGGHDVLNGKISAGQLSAFVFYAVLVAGATGAISEVVGSLQSAAGAAGRIFDLLEEKPTITAPPHPAALPPPKGELVFEHVTFAYPARPNPPALQDVSFAVQPGERMAIVGPSGAGKTTIFQLILRFYDPQTGAVKLDGLDIKTADPEAVRARIGIVPQDPVIFSTDAWHNIGYGKQGASHEEILAAARAAHADEFLLALPQGYDTFLGEKGVRLSGGQKQRIAIARAILRNPPLLLLDEATSALDAESERLVQDALGRLMQGRTTLIIAHRLATVMNAGRIVVLDQGKIVASGTHQDLIRQGGLYARLAQLQFEGAEQAA